MRSWGWSRRPEERISLAGPLSDPTGYEERLGEVVRSGRYDIWQLHGSSASP